MRTYTAQKMKFSIKVFFSKCDQICSFLWIWSHLMKKSLTKFSFFAQLGTQTLVTWTLDRKMRTLDSIGKWGLSNHLDTRDTLFTWLHFFSALFNYPLCLLNFHCTIFLYLSQLFYILMFLFNLHTESKILTFVNTNGIPNILKTRVWSEKFI